MKEELQIDLLEVFVKHKVVSETVLRNEKNQNGIFPNAKRRYQVKRGSFNFG